MSVTASIDVQLARRNNKKISALQLINTFISGNWRVLDKGIITYLPLGDHDYFDWQSDEINIEELTEIVNKKEACGELVGLELLWDTTDIGGHLLIHSELNFSFSIIINRKELNSLNNDRVTDINWYVERIIVLLKNSDYIVESFSFNEYW